MCYMKYDILTKSRKIDSHTFAVFFLAEIRTKFNDEYVPYLFIAILNKTIFYRLNSLSQHAMFLIFYNAMFEVTYSYIYIF